MKIDQAEIPKSVPKTICGCVRNCYLIDMIQSEKPKLLFGYARVSTEEQSLDLQIDALMAYGVDRDRILTDKASGGSIAGRPGFKNAIKAMRPGAGLVIWKMDRLGRNLSELIQTADLVRQRDAQLISLTEHIETHTASGKLMFHMIGMFAQFERDMISERTRAGLAARKARGKQIGRTPSLSRPEIRQQVISHLRDGLSVPEIASLVDGVSQSTLYNHHDELLAEAVKADAEQVSEKVQNDG